MDNILSYSSGESIASDDKNHPQEQQPEVHYYNAPPGDDNDVGQHQEETKDMVIEEEAIIELLNSSIVSMGTSPAADASNLPNVSTLVFFDLETTGLPNFKEDPNVQITEITMIAVSRKDFGAIKHQKDIRVINKLSLCVKPRSIISPIAAKLTGLNDSNLQPHRTFDHCTGQIVCNFMMRLPEPFCLLAHNGDIFDFPLLIAELKRLNLSLPNNTYTADTLIAFRSFHIFDPPPTEQNGNKKRKKNSDKQKGSYSLANLFRHFNSKSARKSHSSEGDCDSLMLVCHKTKDQMLPWIDENKKLLSSFKSMW